MRGMIRFDRFRGDTLEKAYEDMGIPEEEIHEGEEAKRRPPRLHSTSEHCDYHRNPWAIRQLKALLEPIVRRLSRLFPEAPSGHVVLKEVINGVTYYLAMSQCELNALNDKVRRILMIGKLEHLMQIAEIEAPA